jgi:hypothetical protein
MHMISCLVEFSLSLCAFQIKTYYNPLKVPPMDQNFAPIFASFVKEKNDKCLEEDNNPVFEIRKEGC